MVRRRSLALILVLAALVACGGPAATVGNQALTAPTATAPSPSAPVTGSTPTATPTAPAAAPPTPTTAATSALLATRAATTPRPGVTATVATPAVAATPQPNGPIPAGWRVYRGTSAFPFVVAYPPDWTVDDSLLPDQRVIYLYGPGDRETGERIDIEISQVASGANIDVQRDQFFRQESEFCDRKGIEYTEHRQVAGVAFAILGATCDAANVLSFMQVASGLKGGDEWNILMRTPYARKEARLREVFDPVLASLNIYAAIP